MRIGILARCDTQGLGIQSKEFFDHIPCKALVIDVSKINATQKQNHDWYPNQQVYYLQNKYATWNNAKHRVGLEPIPESVIEEFIKDIDLLITFETPYDYNIFSMCYKRGIKTILQLNYEFLEYPSNLPQPDLFAAPSMWHYNEIPSPKVFLPVPVNTSKFSQKHKSRYFTHIVGKAAIHDRNGTQIFLSSLQYVKEDIVASLRSQKLINKGEVPHNVSLTYDCRNKENYYDNYSGGVLVLPRKYGGLSLIINESLASGMPVIAPDISPNNLWLPKEWLVPATKGISFKCKKTVEIYETKPEDIAAKIEEFCDSVFYNTAVEKAIELSKTISWETMLPKYYQTFNDLVNGCL